MLDFVQLLVSNADLSSDCMGLGPIITVIKLVFKLIQFAIPIALILFGTIDLGKAVISSDEKEVKKAQSTLIKRCIYAVAIFFIVTLVSLIMGIVTKGVSTDDGGSSNTANWATCWDSV